MGIKANEQVFVVMPFHKAVVFGCVKCPPNVIFSYPMFESRLFVDNLDVHAQVYQVSMKLVSLFRQSLLFCPAPAAQSANLETKEGIAQQAPVPIPHSPPPSKGPRAPY